MTIDEAILLEFALKNCYGTDHSYHKQLQEWLEELKHIRQWKSDIMDGFCKYDASSFEEIVANARNKAIDDAMEESAKAICIGCGYLNVTKCTYKGCNCSVSKPMLETVMKALEQLKAGGSNEG